MDRIDMSLDDIIKDNKKKQKQKGPGNNTFNNGSSNNNIKTGPIRTRTAGKKLTRQKANPYPKQKTKVKAGNSNGVWRHDLFKTLNPGSPAKRSPIPPTTTGGGLSIQQRLGTGTSAGVTSRMSIKGVAGVQQNQFSFKGEGGPATIIINNLAPGTSANDIKTAFMDFGDILTLDMKPSKSNRLPVNAELTFESKASAIAATKKYNTALVDGRVLKVQLKQAASVTTGAPTNAGAALYRLKSKVPKAQQTITSQARNGKLYSDQLMGGVSNTPTTRRVTGGKGKQPSFSVTL